MRVSEFIKKHVKPLLCVAGLGIGFINGFFGGGGGMLCVPVLAGIAGLSTKQSHATALAVMLPLTVVSAIVYLVSGKVDVNVLFPVGGGFIAGGAIGALLLNKLKSDVISVAFACVMIFAGVRMLF